MSEIDEIQLGDAIGDLENILADDADGAVALEIVQAALRQQRVPEGYTLIWKEGVPHLIPF